MRKDDTNKMKTFGLISAYLVLVFLLLTPLFMYFSHDVSELKSEYPHIINMRVDPPEFELREGKPKSWVKLSSVSRNAKWAIVLSEDWGFYQHQGIDVNQIKAAFGDMLEVKRFRGASTITQQMVKNVFLSEERTIWRKIHEVILSQKVEKVLSKDRILEVYFNCIEFGPGIYGIKNASYHYFKKHPSLILPHEGAFLAMLLPSPKRYYASFKKKALTPFARSRVNAILGKMRMGKIITPTQYDQYKNRKLRFEK